MQAHLRGSEGTDVVFDDKRAKEESDRDKERQEEREKERE